MVKCVDSGTIMPGFESWFYHCVTLKGSLNFSVPQCLHLRNRVTGLISNVSYYNQAYTIVIGKNMNKTSKVLITAPPTLYYISCCMPSNVWSQQKLV